MIVTRNAGMLEVIQAKGCSSLPIRFNIQKAHVTQQNMKILKNVKPFLKLLFEQKTATIYSIHRECNTENYAL